LIKKWKQKRGNANFEYLENKTDLENLNEDTDFALGLFALEHLDYVLHRNNSVQPSLDMMVKKAIKLLKKNENGFFLMVEGGRIDKGHHENKAKHALEETLELEKAVKLAKELTDDDETLIIVTADHSHAMTINGYPERGNNILGYTYSESWKYYIDQEDGKTAWSTISYANGDGFLDHFTGDPEHPWKDMKNLDFTADDYRQPAMFKPYKNRSETHGGEDVPILATGPWAHLFVGVHEQSYFSHAIEYAAGWSNKTDLENTQLSFDNSEEANAYIQRLENEIEEKKKEIKRVTHMLATAKSRVVRNMASKRNQTFQTLFALFVFIFILN